mgnify:CR=1 FL=1
MNFGVIGYGSIGKRHVNNLVSLGYNNITLFRSISSGNRHSLKELNDFDRFLDTNLDGVIISNPTSLHAEFLYQILNRNLNVLVEKPVISSKKQYQLVINHLNNYKGIGMTAYNMRFHPCITELSEVLKRNMYGKVFSARFFVGQYLPDWVPKRNYSKSYSAKKKLGGGVLFDLIHEIDLAYFLIGKPHGGVLSKVGRLSKLNIDSEDMAELLYSTIDKKFVSIHLDYLSQSYKRCIEIITEKANIEVDLYSSKISIFFRNSDVEIKSFPNFSKNMMYKRLILNFINSIKQNKESAISLKEGLISNKIAIKTRFDFYNEK